MGKQKGKEPHERSSHKPILRKVQGKSVKNDYAQYVKQKVKKLEKHKVGTEY